MSWFQDNDPHLIFSVGKYAEILAHGLTRIEATSRGVGLIVEPTKRRFLRPRDVSLASLPSRLRLIGERDGLEHHGVGLGRCQFR